MFEIQPDFVHLDKDFAEIGAAKNVWPGIKVLICMWHAKRELRSERVVGALRKVSGCSIATRSTRLCTVR